MCKTAGCGSTKIKARGMCKTCYEKFLSVVPQEVRSPGHAAQERLKALPREVIADALRDTNGNVTAAGRLLGFKRQQIRTYVANNVWAQELSKQLNAEYYTEERLKENNDIARKRWREKNPDKVREINRRWAKNQSPEKRARWNNYNRKRRYDSMSKDIMSAESEHYASIIKNDPCVWCGSTDTESSIDHIVPIVDGGSNQWENFAPACRSCNSAKNRKSVLEFLLADGLKTKK